MKKRAMALALSVAMVLGSVPLSVSAEEPEVSVEVVEAEANEAQAGAEAAGEPAEEAEEAEEIIAEPQIAVESLEQVDEPAEVTEPSEEDEAAPIAEEVELGALDTPVAAAIEDENVELSNLSLRLKDRILTSLATIPDDISITWDPADSQTPGKANLEIRIKDAEGGESILNPNYYSVQYLDANKVSTDGKKASLNITFGSGDEYPYTKLKGETVKIPFTVTARKFSEVQAKLGVTYTMDDGAKKDGQSGSQGTYYYTYDGKAHGVKDLTITDNGVALTKDTHYTIVDYDKVNAGEKQVNIKGAENSSYSADATQNGIVTYRIEPRDAATEGGIEVPDVTVLANGSKYTGTSDDEEEFLKKVIKDTLVNKRLDQSIDTDLDPDNTVYATGLYEIIYYTVNDKGEVGKKVLVDGENGVFRNYTTYPPKSENGTVEANKDIVEYFYYVLPKKNGVWGNYKEVEEPTGTTELAKLDKLQGKITIVLKDQTRSLEDAYKLVKDQIENYKFPYNGRDNRYTIEQHIKDAFKTINNEFGKRIDVTPAEIGKKDNGDPDYEELVDVKNGYVITISGNEDYGWAGQKITTTVNIVPANINGTGSNKWNTDILVVTDEGITMTKQGMNVDEDKRYVNHTPKVEKVNLKWKSGYGPNTIKSGNDYTNYAYTGGGAELKEGIDFEVVVPEPAADGKITSVTIKGIGNFTSEQKVDVKQEEVIDLELFKDNVTVTTNADGVRTSVVIKDKAGTTVPSGAYEVKETCVGCDNGQHKAGKVHKIKITATKASNYAKYTAGKDNAGFEVTFRVSEEKFADAYNVESSITSPKVDTKITGDLPHQQVVISQKANPNVFYAPKNKCTWKYVWTDPQTGRTLTIPGKDFEEGVDPDGEYAIKNYLTSGNDVRTKTFPEVGTWKLVLEPTDALDNGRYTGSLEVEFTVGSKAFDKNTVTIAKKKSILWPGKPAEAADLAEGLTVTDIDTKKELKYDKDYVITAIADADLVQGDATVTLSGKEGSKYDSQTMTAKVYIAARPLSDADLTIKEGALDYTGEAFTTLPSDLVTVSFAKGTLVVDPSEYTITAQGANGAVGTNVTVTVTANDYRKGFHYTGSKSTTDKITAADISHKDVFQLEGVEAQYLYDPENGAEQKDLKLKDIRTQKYIELNPQYTYVDNKKVGTAKVQVTAADSTTYKGTAEAEFQVMAPGAANVILKQDTYTYTGKAIEPEVEKVTALDGSALSSSSWTVKEYVDNVNAGRATVVVAVTVNGETLEIVKDFTISPARINASDVSDPAATYEYNGDVIRPVVTVTVNGQTLKAGTDYIVMNTESTAVGRKELAVQGKGNYTGDVLKKFEVVAASVANAKITGLNASYAYNGAVRKPAVTVTLGSKVLKKGRDYKIAYTNNANVGAKNVKVTGIGNYTGSVKTTFQVVPKKAVISKITVGKKRISVAVAAQTGAKYHIQYREAGTKKWTGVVTKNATQAISGLKSGKNYIVRVRAYKVIQGKKVLGAWSAAKATGKVK